MKKQYLLFIFITLLGVVIGIYQYIQIFQAEIAGADSTTYKHPWSEIECTAGLCVTTDSKVGIGTDTPTKKLEVAGDILISGDLCDSQGHCLSDMSNITNACGTAAKTYAYTDTALSGTYCFSGSPTPASTSLSFPAAGSDTCWTCPVVSGDAINCCATHSPSAASGACGTANNTNSYSAPSSAAELCSQGTATTVTASTYSWTWACNGIGGGNTVSCLTNRIINGSCGSTGPYSSLSIGPCSAGTSADFSGSGPWTWSCYGINGGTTASCTGSYGHTASCSSMPGWVSSIQNACGSPCGGCLGADHGDWRLLRSFACWGEGLPCGNGCGCYY